MLKGYPKQASLIRGKAGKKWITESVANGFESKNKETVSLQHVSRQAYVCDLPQMNIEHHWVGDLLWIVSMWF